MAAIRDLNNALDFKDLDEAKRLARDGSAEGTRKIGRKFEALFLNMMLKGMRDSLPHDDPLESDASRMATSMLDGQLAQSMAGKGLGLSDAIVKQIERSQPTGRTTDRQGTDPIPVKAPDPAPMPLRRDLRLDTRPTKADPVQQTFVDTHREAAEAASRASSLPTKFILGHAALESGWGRHEPRGADGTGSFNLFGVKADSTWKGPTVEAVTTEFVNGMAQKVVQKFRAYASYTEGFLDYARLVTRNPRYSQAMQAVHDVTRFAREMGRSGYATDPDYGDKLSRILTGPLSNIG